jgi:hypothetical protein
MPADKGSIGNLPVAGSVPKYVDRPSSALMLSALRLSWHAPGSVSSSGMSTPRESTGTTFSLGRFLLGILLSALGHGVAVGATFVAGAVVEPSTGGGFEDVAAAVGAFVVIEALLFIAVLIALVGLLMRGRHALALGIFLGWLAGPIVYFGARVAG